MLEEELPYPGQFEGYEFELEDETRNLYSFQTKDGALYNVIFKPSPYVFGEDAVFAPYLYELIIELENEENIGKGTDKRLPFTVYDIFVDFYKRNGDLNICLYICNSSDGRQIVRARKFMYWFRLLNQGGIIYVGDDIKDSDGIIYPVAILMKLNNPYRSQILDAFNNLISDYKK